MGGSNNYSSQINTGLQQANMPKSPLAQNLSSTLNNNYQQILSSLLNGGATGNAFPGLMGGQSTAGSALNSGGYTQFQGQQFNQQLNPATVGDTQIPKNNTPEYQGVLDFLGKSNPNTFQRPDGTQFKLPAGQTDPNLAKSNVFPEGPSFNPQGLASLTGINPGNGGQPNFNLPDFSSSVAQSDPNLNASTYQSNPQQGQLNLGGPNQNILQSLLTQFQSPQFQNQNQSADLLSQLSGQQQPGVDNLSTFLQSALARSANTGGAQLPNMNVGNANLQSAAPQNINPNNVGLQLGAPNAQDSDYYNSAQQVLGNQYNQGLKDLQARFGASGGASRGTPAAYAQAQYSSQALPQLGAALGNIRQQEAGNQLTAQNQANNALLTNRGQDINNSQQNVQNYLQSIGLNNNSNLQGRQQDIDLLGLNQQGALQNQGLVNQSGNDNLNSLSSLFNSVGGQQNNQLSILSQLANNAGQLGLGQNQLTSQNQFNNNQLNSQNSNNALSQLLGFQSSNNQSQLGQNQLNAGNSQFNAGQSNSNLQAINQLLSGNSQFNAGQKNSMNQNLLQMLQQANQQQINNQFTGNQNLAQILAQFGLSGIPGGSANINLSASPQSGGGLAGLGAIGSLLSGIAAF